MKILVTGAKGFVGKNLCAQLNNIRTGKAVCHGDLVVTEVMEYDRDSSQEDLDRYCRDCDFVFHLAGVNRPTAESEYMEGNAGFLSVLLDTLRKYGNRCPVMMSSSVQATLEGRYEGSSYGRSKRAAEQLMAEYGHLTGAKVLVYRFPNVFGKWCRPNYNSAVATFCSNIANDLPIQVNDRDVELELLYIDDLVEEMIWALKGEEHHCREYPFCRCTVTHKATLGEITDMLYGFAEYPETLMMPKMPPGSLAMKLYSTYLSYLPASKASFFLNKNADARGSFTEIIRIRDCGQISINVSRPGATKGQHWHNSKWEIFVVVSGHGLIRLRKIDTEEILTFEVDGRNPQPVFMLPGYTHSLVNLSEKEDMVTIIYSNEIFDPDRPDTYSLSV